MHIDIEVAAPNLITAYSEIRTGRTLKLNKRVVPAPIAVLIINENIMKKTRIIALKRFGKLYLLKTLSRVTMNPNRNGILSALITIMIKVLH